MQKEFPYVPFPNSFLIIHILLWCGHLLQFLKQSWYRIVNYSSLLPLGFVLCAVHSVGFDKRTASCGHRVSLTQNSFPALKFPCASLIHPSSLPLPKPFGNPWYFYYLYSFAFPKVSYKFYSLKFFLTL